MTFLISWLLSLQTDLQLLFTPPQMLPAFLCSLLPQKTTEVHSSITTSLRSLLTYPLRFQQSQRTEESR